MTSLLHTTQQTEDHNKEVSGWTHAREIQVGIVCRKINVSLLGHEEYLSPWL